MTRGLNPLIYLGAGATPSFLLDSLEYQILPEARKAVIPIGPTQLSARRFTMSFMNIIKTIERVVSIRDGETSQIVWQSPHHSQLITRTM